MHINSIYKFEIGTKANLLHDTKSNIYGVTYFEITISVLGMTQVSK